MSKKGIAIGFVLTLDHPLVLSGMLGSRADMREAQHFQQIADRPLAVDDAEAILEISLTTGQSPQTIQRYFEKAEQSNSAAAKMLG